MVKNEYLKLKKEFQLKESIQQLDNETDLVSFYFVKFNELDSENDVFFEGCFDKTLDINKIRYFLNHDLNKPIGTVNVIEKDSDGYIAKCKIIDNSLISGVKDMYKSGLIRNHSFVAFATKYEKNEYGGLNIYEADLIEVSALTGWGANQNTELISIKNNNMDNNNTIMNNIEKVEVKKMNDEEANLINSKIESISKMMNDMQNSLFELTNTVNSLKETNLSETETEPMISLEESKQKSKKQKSVINNGLINQVKKVRLNPKLIKSVNVTGTGTSNLSYAGLDNTRYGFFSLSGLQKVVETNSIDISYSLVSTVAPANNIGVDCYVSNPTNIAIQKYQVHLDRLVARTSYCQSEILSLDENDFFNEIQMILEQEIKQTLGNVIYNQMTTLGTNQTATPSWVPLAGAIPTPTIYDILAIHTQDIYQLTNGKVSNEIVMVLNPADYARLLTDKITFMYVQMPTQINVFKDVAIPIGNYVVFPMDYLKLFIYNQTEIQSALDGIRPFDGIVNTWINLYAHFGLRAENANTVIYGNINTALTNY